MLKHIVISYSIIVFYIVCSSNHVSRKDYGKFTTKILRFDVCKGPKRVHCGNVVAKVVNETNLMINYSVIKDMIPSRGNIVSVINNKTLIKLQMKKPCDNLFMKPILQTIFNLTSTCMFQQGNYSMNLDIDKIAQKHYGGMFLYGDLTFRAALYNEECNFACALIEVMLYPKRTP